VKRRDLERIIARQAKARDVSWAPLRTVGGHDIWSLDGVRISIPRHAEISDGVTRRILRDTEEKLGKDWWR
jgi:hypothetical protein